MTIEMKLFSNFVLFVEKLLTLFAKIYPEGAQCAAGLSTPAAQCSNTKVFVNELNRLFDLFSIGAQAKLS